MLTLQNVSFEFAGRWLYQDLNWQIKPGEQIGLIGRNGCGKSTLLRLMVGEYQPTEGRIDHAKDLRIGFLNQDLLSFESDAPIFDVALQAFDRQLKLKEEIDAQLNRLESNNTPEELEKLQTLQLEFEHLDGWRIEAKTHEVLAGLGFSESDRQQPYNTFSGGWRMRVMLAKILLTDPDLLLLDEPTNHLDLPSIQWLEGYIQTFRGSYIIVSHDRDILDRMVTSIVEIAHKKAQFYTGNFTKYREEKTLRQEQLKAAYENQQKYIQETQQFIDRFRAKATKAAQVQTRIKMLEKLERVPEPESNEKTVTFRFPPTARAGIDILKLKHISKAYGDKVILSDTSATIQRGEKIGLVGANGVGKSTVLRILAGTEPHEGQRELGHQVNATFFAQHQLEALDIRKSIWDEVYSFAAEKGEPTVRSILGSLLFSGEDIEKKIQILSGGEKSRVALAKTLLADANFLLLDEPTNHLDMQSIEILIQALQQFDGTFVLVSHDRFFLRQVTEKIWYIEDQQIKEYPGDFGEYEHWLLQRQQNGSPQAEVRQAQIHQPAPTRAPATAAKAEAPKKPSQEQRKQVRKLQNQLKKIEEKIEALEAERETLTAEMSSEGVSSDYTKLFPIQEKLARNEMALEQAMESWETLEEQISALS